MIKSKEKKVVVYGVGGSLKEAFNYIDTRFEIVAFSDSDNSKATSKLIKGYSFIAASDIHELQYDYVIVCSIYDHEIKQRLVEEYKLEESVVLLRDEWQRIPVKTSFGELNPQITFYIIAKSFRTRNGLISIVYSTIKQLNEINGKDYIPIVDMQNYRNQYLSEDKLGKENSWEYYFEQLSPFGLNEVYHSKNVILGYDAPDYLYGYENWLDISGLQKMFVRYIRLKREISETVRNEYNKLFDATQKVLGVVYRGTDYNNLQLKHHSIQPDLEELTELIQKYLKDKGYTKIFISTEDEVALEKLKAQFGDRLIYTNQMRFKNTGDKWLANIHFERENDGVFRGLEYLTTVMLLTKCDGLIGGECAASVFAHIVGYNKFEVVDLFDKGVY